MVGSHIRLRNFILVRNFIGNGYTFFSWRGEEGMLRNNVKRNVKEC